MNSDSYKLFIISSKDSEKKYEEEIALEEGEWVDSHFS